MSIASRVLDLLFPPRCLFCSALLPEESETLCPNCKKQEGELVKTVRRKGADFTLCISPLVYDGPVREAILRYKFSGSRSKARGFAPYLAQAVSEELGGKFDTVTYVPTHPLRVFSRGFDQSRLLTQELCRIWQVEPETLLKKQRHNKANSSLQGAARRRANVLGAYRVVKNARVQGKRILLIDDIITTGSTLSECARILLDAGAQAVYCATLAATEKKED